MLAGFIPWKPDVAKQYIASGYWEKRTITDVVSGRYVFTEGRKRDLINRSGEKISSEEVENLIFKNPKVHQVSLVAMPNPVFGEKACAFVILKAGQNLTFEDLIAFLKQQNIAIFKLSERLEVVEQFPSSLVDKILKRQLREMIVEKITREQPSGS